MRRCAAITANDKARASACGGGHHEWLPESPKAAPLTSKSEKTLYISSCSSTGTVRLLSLHEKESDERKCELIHRREGDYKCAIASDPMPL